jgi:hypothetical protein
MIQGFLTAEKARWRIPPYAQDMLWVQSGEQAAQASGPRGAFTLEVNGAEITLAWGVPDGPQLAKWPVCPTGAPVILDWPGSVGAGGFVERLHILETRGLELVVAEIEGDLFPAGYGRLPKLADMRAGPFRRHDETGFAGARPFTYTFLALADSVYAEYLHHAMVSELAVDCFATLGPQDGRWHEIVGLPLLLDSMSLLAPG